MIRFGMSGLPPGDGADDAAFLDNLVARGHRAYELAFVNDFPWKEKRCRSFGELAAARDLALSVHAPYFAVLTSEEPDKRKLTLSALEHTMKLGKALGARTVVAHAGYVRDRTPDRLHELIHDGLDTIAPKVRHLGVALGLETSGTERSFGSLGDIALIASEFSFVRPVVDWAHLHAKAQGALTEKDAFLAVIAFLRDQFPGWQIDPLHCHFTDNEFGPKGEIKHVPYGEGTLRSGPLAEAVVAAGLRMVLISEAHDPDSHDLIFADLRSGMAAAAPEPAGAGRPLHSGRIEFPDTRHVTAERDGFRADGLDRPLRVSNIDKEYFPSDGYTKGDLLQYYAAIAPLLLPHLEGRAIVLARFPDGAEGDWFYEKECPSHAPDWMAKAPLHSEHRGEPINFCTAPDVESLLWIANLGCIEIHPWLSRIERPNTPDFAVFDLDPAEGASWDQVVYVAGLLRVLLERLGLASYPKTSGATGLHIYVPLEPDAGYRQVRKFVETLGRMIVTADASAATMEWDIPKRAGKVFIDHNQNVGGKTIASVYSVRPRPGAPVSMPLLWEELDRITPADFTIATIWPRLRQYGDLFAPVMTGGQPLDGAARALGLPDDPG
jgi:bifunctional non-homologous end joining protein LigD